MKHLYSLFTMQLPHRAIVVYLYLYYRSNAEGTCFPSIDRIAHDLQISRSTVKRALADLSEAELIKKEERNRENGGKTSNLYYLL